MAKNQLWLERIADTEGTGRLVNEQLRRSTQDRKGEAPGDALFRCECGNDVCHEPLSVPREVYERVRGDSMLFLIRPGHEMPEAEDVVDSGDGFEIVRKHENVRTQVEKSDPRRGAPDLS